MLVRHTFVSMQLLFLLSFAASGALGTDDWLINNRGFETSLQENKELRELKLSNGIVSKVCAWPEPGYHFNSE